ncbi:MAG: biotin/lipoate A/B protein ligase family protein [Bacteriovoracaceae bacterium]
MNVFVSPFRNPFLNLAIEDYFLREGSYLPVAFFYINRPCVVLGRFQNPWIECHLPYLAENDIWMVRRQSGGGCVFHDEGNLNFSFITPDSMVDRRKHGELIQRAFKRSGIELTISPRNDLWLNERKISGSAYKQTKNGSFHHGTFLVNSDLNKLEESLKNTIVPKSSKSIASVRSKVITLSEVYPGITIEDVIELIAHEIRSPIQEIEGAILSLPMVQESFDQLTSWDWLWGETPAFELENLSIYKGRIDEKKFDRETMKGILSDSDLNKLFPNFSHQYQEAKRVF